MTRERRTSVRFSLPEGQDRALLRVGLHNVPVQILNASTTGFLLAGPQIDVHKGQQFWLRTTAAWTHVRIVSTKDFGAEAHIGVERLEDLEETPEFSVGWSPLSWLAPAQILSSGFTNVVLALCLLGGMFIGLFVLNRQNARASSVRARSHFGQTLNDFQRDLERAWSRVGNAAGRFVSRFSFGSHQPATSTAPPGSTSNSRQPPMDAKQFPVVFSAAPDKVTAKNL